MFQKYFIEFISIFSNILIFLIFARVVLSWLRIVPRGFLFVVIVETTEPILSVFRRVIPPIGGVLDLSPFLAYLAIDLLRGLLIRFFI